MVSTKGEPLTATLSPNRYQGDQSLPDLTALGIYADGGGLAAGSHVLRLGARDGLLEAKPGWKDDHPDQVSMASPTWKDCELPEVFTLICASRPWEVS